MGVLNAGTVDALAMRTTHLTYLYAVCHSQSHRLSLQKKYCTVLYLLCMLVIMESTIFFAATVEDFPLSTSVLSLFIRFDFSRNDTAGEA